MNRTFERSYQSNWRCNNRESKSNFRSWNCKKLSLGLTTSPLLLNFWSHIKASLRSPLNSNWKIIHQRRTKTWHKYVSYQFGQQNIWTWIHYTTTSCWQYRSICILSLIHRYTGRRYKCKSRSSSWSLLQND